MSAQRKQDKIKVVERENSKESIYNSLVGSIIGANMDILGWAHKQRSGGEKRDANNGHHLNNYVKYKR